MLAPGDVLMPDGFDGGSCLHLPSVIRSADDDLDFDRVAAEQPRRDYQDRLVRALAARRRTASTGTRLRITVATGGGKTRIANDWLEGDVLPRGQRALWVTKDWELLRQAASDRARRHHGALDRMSFVGTTGRRLLAPLHEGTDGDVVYTTLHSWSHHLADKRRPFDVVVIDEAHWGEEQSLQRDLFRRYERQALFLGLTATPKEKTRYELVGEEYPYHRLAADGFLAKAVAHTIKTGTSWRPVPSPTRGDFANVGELARDAARNRRIVDEYLSRAPKLGKTIVFACDIDHARTLTSQFNRGLAVARCLHSGMSLEERRETIAWYRRTPEGVLVNVAMAIYGWDVPDIRTVFLARPTASATLFAQMVGRGTRKAPDKATFNVFDFVDNLQEHGEMLVTARDYFGSLPVGAKAASSSDSHATSPQTSRSPSPRRTHHGFEPSKLEFLPVMPDCPELAGLDYAPGQTFGIEFELSRPGFVANERPADWDRIACALLDALPPDARAPRPLGEYHDASKDHGVWNVEWDGSCGWEITSRVLEGVEGFAEVARTARSIETVAHGLGLDVGFRTGTHLHLGWRKDLRAMTRLVQVVSHFEPALHTLLAPSRFGNMYCRSIRTAAKQLVGSPEATWAAFWKDDDARYHGVNLMHLFDDLGTVEVRLHNGTIDGPKILTWLSLWMRVLALAAARNPIPETRFAKVAQPFVAGREGDVLALAAVAVAGSRLVERLRARRRVVADRWTAQRPDLAVQIATRVAEWVD